jgi:glycosyltransferase involved in cell wall biosynthesis
MVAQTLNKAKRRVIVISTDPWLDRLHGASILELFNALSGLGYSVKVVVPSIKKVNFEDGYFSVTALDTKRYVPLFNLLSFYGRVLKLVSKERNFLLIFDPSILPLFLLIRFFRKSKGIMLILSRPLIKGNLFGYLAQMHFRFFLLLGKMFVTRFTAISPFEAIEFARLGNIPRQKIIVLPSPVGKKFEMSNFGGYGKDLRHKLGLDAESKVLLYHGVLDEKRGIHDLLELFAQITKDDNKIVLLLVGDGPARKSVENFIACNQAGNIIFLGPIAYSRMPEVIKACDVGLVLLPNDPNWQYQCPTKLVEFLALGKPVIASELPGIRWVARGSPSVFYISNLDLPSFRKILDEVLIKKAGTMGNCSIRREIISYFSSTSIALKLSRVIDSI